MKSPKAHICPICGRAFLGGGNKVYCSLVCKQRAYRAKTGKCHNQHDESLEAYREALSRAWFCPEPWVGKEDTQVYGNMVFL